MTTENPVLEVRALRKYFSQGGLLDTLFGETREIQAVDGVSFTLRDNQSIGIIGESGCGKTTLIKSLIGLHEPTDGEILFRGTPLSSFKSKQWKEYRKNVQMIFQDPFNSLDPKFTVEEMLREQLKIHNMGDVDERIDRVLSQVELRPPERFKRRFPRQLSGGEKQRVAIARALIVEPSVILADEPVSMLDVSTQASILEMISNIQREMGVSVIYISHDISTVTHISDTIAVMYLGRIIELAPTDNVISDPKHPYTQSLIQSVPVPDPFYNRQRTQIGGTPQDPVDIDEGCRFRDRCPERMSICDKTPWFIGVEDNHEVSCHLYYDHDEVNRDQRQDTSDGSSCVKPSSGGSR